MITVREAKNAIYLLEQFIKQNYPLEASEPKIPTPTQAVPMSDKQKSLITDFITEQRGIFPIGFETMDIMAASDYIAKYIPQEFIIARRTRLYPRKGQ